MKRFLIPESGQFYKANLHCHTTVSDGKMTPEEVKSHYAANGYSIVAFTDHCVLVPHPELADKNFLPLNGYETEFIAKADAPVHRRKHCHLCFIPLKKDNITMPYTPREVWGNAKTFLDRVKYNADEVFDAWYHDPAIINRVIRLAREAGFFVTYNHPVWSAENYKDYTQLTGFNAMEIMNFSSWTIGLPEYNPGVYDDILRNGQHVFAMATDDNHSLKDACGGWTMIKADSLDYETITDALCKGSFYASWGPEIHQLWFEDGHVHVTTSPAAKILCSFPERRARVQKATPEGPLTETVFPIEKDDVYFRITVVDDQGRCADTNAYFTEDLF